jgi:hypothetical protein
MSLAGENEVFNQIYTEFKELVQDIEAKPENFMDFVVKAMEKVESYAVDVKDEIIIHGIEKKELVEDMLNKLYDDLDIEEAELEKIKVELKVWLDRTIDVLVAASKGNIGLKSDKKKKKKTNNKADLIIGAAGSDSADVEKIANQVYDIVRGSIANKKFTASNFVILVTIVMQVVERAQTLTGPEKKYVAVSVIKRLFMEIPFPEEEREAIAVIIEFSLSKTIDYIIAAARGELHVDLEIVVSGFKKLFPCCFKSTEVVE